MSAMKFEESRLMQVLVAPIVSEKATMIAEKSNSVTFKVLQNATKPEIKAAVELMFKVEVKGVSVVNTKGKSKRFGKSMGRRDNIRKAYVTLKPGQELNLAARGFVLGDSTLRESTTASRPSRASCENMDAIPARYIFLLILWLKFSSGMFGKIRPPPRRDGIHIFATRA